MLAQFDRHLAISREIGLRQGEAVALHNLGVGFGMLGVVDEEKSRLEDALSVAHDIAYSHLEAATLSALGTAAKRRGDADTAAGYFESALDLFRELGVRDEQCADALLRLGEVLATLGRTDEALARLDECLAIADTNKLPKQRVLASAHVATLAPGRSTAMVAAIAEQADHFEHGARTEARFLLWKVMGDRAHLAEAHRLLRFGLDHAPPEHRDTMVENVPLHREIMAAWKEHGGAEAGD
jgi:tetratricopeptide (TPR) repeat protein